MKIDINRKINEIRDFISAFKPQQVESDKAAEAFTACYKQFHATLIWQCAIDNNRSEPETVKLYLNEATADLSSALLCALLHLYKPSRMILRSAVENIMRVAVLMDEREALSAKSTYELAGLFNSGKLTGNKVTNNSIQSCLRLYDKLCKHVHTSTPMHMNGRIPFVAITDPVEELLLDCLVDIGQVSAALNKFIFFSRPTLLSRMNHHDADYILDRVPSELKRSAQAH